MGRLTSMTDNVAPKNALPKFIENIGSFGKIWWMKMKRPLAMAGNVFLLYTYTRYYILFTPNDKEGTYHNHNG